MFFRGFTGDRNPQRFHQLDLLRPLLQDAEIVSAVLRTLSRQGRGEVREAAFLCRSFFVGVDVREAVPKPGMAFLGRNKILGQEILPEPRLKDSVQDFRFPEGPVDQNGLVVDLVVEAA